MTKIQQHSFRVEDAEAHGVASAIILQTLRYWLEGHIAAGRNERDGEVWNYVSIRQLGSIFPYWSPRQIRTALEKLIDAEVLITANFNRNANDRTLWYAIPGFLAAYRNGQIPVTKKSNGVDADVTALPLANSVAEPNKKSPISPLADEQAALEAYNDRAKQHGWAEATKLNAFRRKRLPARLKDADGIEGWCAALDRILQSPFLMGKTDHRFKMNLDSLLGDKFFTKLVEGGFGKASYKPTFEPL